MTQKFENILQISSEILNIHDHVLPSGEHKTEDEESCHHFNTDCKPIKDSQEALI